MLRPKTKIVSLPFLGFNRQVDVLQLNEKYFVDCNNIDFLLNGVRKRRGYQVFCDQTEDYIIRFANYFFSTGYYLLGFTKTKLVKYDTATNSFAPIGTNTYSSTNYLCYANGFNTIFFTNNIDRVKYWNVTMNDFEDVPGLNDAEPGGIDVSRAKCLVVFENFLMLADTIETGERYATRIRWSRYRDYTLWKNNVDGTGMAGYIDLQSEPSPIQALVPFGNYLFAMKTNCIYGLRFVGSPYVFIVEKLVDDIGLIAPFGYTYYQNMLVFLGNNNVYMFNGSSVIPIGDTIKEYLFNTLNYNRINAVRMFSDVTRNLIFLFYPTSQADDEYCNACLVFNTELKSWTKYDIELTDAILGQQTTDWTWDTTAQSWDITTRTWEEAQTGGGSFIVFSNPKKLKVYNLLDGNDDTVFNYEFYLLTKHFSFENTIQVKRLLEITLFGHSLENLRVRIYYGDDPFFLTNMQEFDVGADGKIQCDISAKYFQFRFELKNKDKNFNLVGYQLRYSERGLR